VSAGRASLRTVLDRLANAVAVATATALVGCGGDGAASGAPPPSPDAGPCADAGAGGDRPREDPVDATRDAAGGAPTDLDAGPVRPPGRLVVNEAMPTPPDGETEWLELTVTGDGSASLGEYALVDDDPAHLPVPLPPGTLSPGAFLRVEASVLPYGLGRDDALHLLRAGERVDTLRWSAPLVARDRSVGRLPDATGSTVSLAPTPGAPNRALAASGGLFDPGHLRSVELSFTEGDWSAITADGAVGPVAATLVLGGADEAGARAVTVMRDPAAPDEWGLTFDADAPPIEGRTALVLLCPLVPLDALRDVVALETAADAGLVVPAAALASVRFQATAPRLCALREAVDPAFAERRLGPGVGLFRVRPPAADLVFRGRAPEAYDGLLPLNAAADPADVVDLVRALAAGDRGAYPAVLDLEATLRLLAFQALVADLSAYGGAATHLALAARAGRVTPLALGMPGAFGGSGCDCTAAERLSFPLGSPVCGPPVARPLVMRLLSAPALRDAYLASLRALLDGALSAARLAERVSAWRAVAATGPVPAGFAETFEGDVEARLEAARAQITAGLPPEPPASAACEAGPAAD
jgi:hypothetical protein